jgi:voltage-gated potassium channel
VGRAAQEQFLASGLDVVVVDIDPAVVAGMTDGLYLVGDVTDDAVLRRAGIEHARALLAALETDADTVYVTLSARALRSDLVIVARARTAASAEKMIMAGATHAVNPERIGGRRLAVFALQPDVAEFLDVVMHEESLDFRIQQIPVEVGSALEGRTLADLGLRGHAGALVLALRPRQGTRRAGLDGEHGGAGRRRADRAGYRRWCAHGARQGRQQAARPQQRRSVLVEA